MNNAVSIIRYVLIGLILSTVGAYLYTSGMVTMKNGVAANNSNLLDNGGYRVINYNLLDWLVSGAIKEITLVYSSGDPQFLMINGYLYVIRDAASNLTATYSNIDGSIYLRIDYLVRGYALVTSGGKIVDRIHNFTYSKSIVLELVNGRYCLDDIDFGYIPFLVRAGEYIEGFSVYILDLGYTGSLVGMDLFDVRLDKSVEYEVDVYLGRVTGPNLRVDMDSYEVPEVLREISMLINRDTLRIIMYSNTKYMHLFIGDGVMVEGESGIALAFNLVGASKVRSDALLSINGDILVDYPVSPLGYYLGILRPTTFFKLVDVDVVYGG